MVRQALRLAPLALAVLLLGLRPAAAVDVQRVVSPGGIEAWLVEDHSIPMTALSLEFRGGAALDPTGEEGLANLGSGLLDEGAGAFDSQAYQRRLEDLSLELSFRAHRDGFGGGMRFLTRHRDAAFDMLRLALTEPRFDPEPVEKVRGQVLTNLASMARNPNALAGRLFWQVLYPEHPYGRPRRGTAESVAALDADDLRGFVARRFARDTLTLGVVGDITAAELKPLLDRTFGALPATAAPYDVPDVAPAATGEVIVAELDVPQSNVLFGHAGLSRDDPDYYVASALNYVLGGGGFSSRLYEEVREKRGLAYSVGSSLSPLDHTALYSGSVGTANGRVAESLEVIRGEWRRMRDAGPTAQELADAKSYMTGNFPLRLGSTTAIARMLVGIQLEDLGIDYIDRRHGYIEAITLEDVRRVAAELLDPDALTFVIVGQPEGVTADRTLEAG